VRGLDDLAPFLVDDAEAEAMGLQTIFSEKEEEAAAASTARGEHAVMHWQVCCGGRFGVALVLLFWVSCGN
jgi:hypothetical protein